MIDKDKQLIPTRHCYVTQRLVNQARTGRVEEIADLGTHVNVKVKWQGQHDIGLTIPAFGFTCLQRKECLN